MRVLCTRHTCARWRSTRRNKRRDRPAETEPVERYLGAGDAETDGNRLECRRGGVSFRSLRPKGNRFIIDGTPCFPNAARSISVIHHGPALDRDLCPRPRPAEPSAAFPLPSASLSGGKTQLKSTGESIYKALRIRRREAKKTNAVPMY